MIGKALLLWLICAQIMAPLRDLKQYRARIALADAALGPVHNVPPLRDLPHVGLVSETNLLSAANTVLDTVQCVGPASAIGCCLCWVSSSRFSTLG
jgi:hypothetical protein